MSLKQFLEEQAEKQQTPEARRERAEWIEAVDQLMGQIRQWLEEADTRGVLEIRDRTYHLNEEEIGPYDARRLDIQFGRRLVEAAPVARYVAGPLRHSGGLAVIRADGRVDLRGDAGRFVLYRIKAGPGEPRWDVMEEDGFFSKRLDRAAFEAAVEQLLS